MPAVSIIRKLELTIAAAIFVIAFVVYWFSPVSQVTDSNYSMLLSQDLLEHRSFLLDHYAIPRLTPEFHYNTIMNGSIHQIEVHDGHFYYYFPPGTSVLSIPFVLVAKVVGVSTTNADGTHNLEKEIAIQVTIAALLMAVLAVIMFFTARLALPVTWSAIIAIGAAFGTQMWSTASRAMWTETWGILLMGVVIWMLFRSQQLGRRLNPYVLGTLLAWTYFVRPTNAVAIFAVTVWVFFVQRRIVLRLVLTGAVWFALFVAYSWYHFHQLLPQYYLANRLAFKEASVALPGNLISPSRGLFVFVPVLLWIGFLLVRYRGEISQRCLVWLSVGIILLHLIVITGFDPWHGGFSYGPRFTTGLVPWFVLLAVLGVKAMLGRRREHTNNGVAWNVQLAVGGVLLLLSVFINARGALARETWIWNVRPTNVDDYPAKIWDWRQPQFLAGWVRPRHQPNIPTLPVDRIDFAGTQAEPFLWYGWSAPDPKSRWTEEREAGIVFRLPSVPSPDLVLKIELSGFVVPSKHSRQRVTAILNGTAIDNFVIEQSEPAERSIKLPASLLRPENELIFKLPDAASPKSLGVSKDPRSLGVAVHWMQFQSVDKRD
ncbi:MAG TPA: hypothetical protein VN643_25575 [Pyrinomonadaceae bacterium]|nr:hypothetical protein [Pyrinomonadaceae bacterium]